MSTTKIAATLVGGSLILSLAACSDTRSSETGSASGGGAGAGAEETALIGIAMPTKSLERWNKDGAHLESKLKEMGYETTLQYADNKAEQQITQLQNMVNQGADVLVVASIDGTALGPVLETAAAEDIEIIAYDRLINGTEAVDYYATFDNYKVGQLQGEFILDNLPDGEPVNLEPFAGSPDDNNAKFFFSGAWDVLKPKIDDGTIEVPSGKSPASNDEWQSIGIQGWSSETAQSEMQNRMNSFYTGDTKVDVVLSPNDSLALGIEQALEAAGYTPGEDWPLVTGQDADEANVKQLLADKQSMTVWKDTRALGDQVATMVDQVVKGEEVEVNDTETYDNTKKIVPTFLLEPEVVTKDTVESTLVESGFYTKEQLGL